MPSNPLLEFVVEAGYDAGVARSALARFSRGGEATLDQAMEVRTLARAARAPLPHAAPCTRRVAACDAPSAANAERCAAMARYTRRPAAGLRTAALCRAASFKRAPLVLRSLSNS